MYSLDSVDLREVVKSEYNVIQVCSDHIKILCPFHSENTGSMAIYSDHYHCYGTCGAHGNAIQWVMNTKNVDIQEAMSFLSSFTYNDPRIQKKQEDSFAGKRPIDRVKWTQVCSAACLYIINYMKSCSDENLKKIFIFKRGFAKTREEAIEFVYKYALGYLNSNTVSQFRLKPDFDGRITIPYRDEETNHLIWVNTRTLNNKEKRMKYKNIGGEAKPYILNKSQIFKKKEALLVEGELDAISLDLALKGQFGIIGLAGGTMFSKGIRKELDFLFNNEILKFIIFDQDEAGKIYTEKMCNYLPNSIPMNILITWPRHNPKVKKDLNDVLCEEDKFYLESLFIRQYLKYKTNPILFKNIVKRKWFFGFNIEE
jgi:DNA primase